jgi:valyl-tRNA synthetase
MGVSPGNDTRFSTEKVEAARNFANKVWNASRFVLMYAQNKEELAGKTLLLPDQWILSRSQLAIREVSAHMEDGDFGLAAQKIYDFAWSELCDWYIELSKSRLMGDDAQSRLTAQAVLLHVLETLLKLLHPFMPFLTEAVFKSLPGSEGFLMLSDWPQIDPAYDFPAEEDHMQGVMDIIRTIRNLRSEMNVAAGKRTRLMLLPSIGWAETLAGAEQYFQRLAGVSHSEILTDRSAITGKTVSAVCASGELFIPLGDLVDFEKEIARLEKEYENLLKEIERAAGKLNNPGFMQKAPAQLKEQEKEKLTTNQAMAATLHKRIAELKGMGE